MSAKGLTKRACDARPDKQCQYSKVVRTAGAPEVRCEWCDHKLVTK